MANSNNAIRGLLKTVKNKMNEDVGCIEENGGSRCNASQYNKSNQAKPYGGSCTNKIAHCNSPSG